MASKQHGKYIYLGYDIDLNSYFDELGVIKIYNPNGNLIGKTKYLKCCENCIHWHGTCKYCLIDDYVCHHLYERFKMIEKRKSSCALCKNVNGSIYGKCTICGRTVCTKCYVLTYCNFLLCPNCILDAMDKRLYILEPTIYNHIFDLCIKTYSEVKWEFYWDKGYNLKDIKNIDIPKPKSESPIDRYIANKQRKAFLEGVNAGYERYKFKIKEYIS